MLPHSDITPCRVERQGHHLLIPLDAVNGQLAGSGGGADNSRVVDDVKHGGGAEQTSGQGQKSAFEEE